MRASRRVVAGEILCLRVRAGGEKRGIALVREQVRVLDNLALPLRRRFLDCQLAPRSQAHGRHRPVEFDGGPAGSPVLQPGEEDRQLGNEDDHDDGDLPRRHGSDLLPYRGRVQLPLDAVQTLRDAAVLAQDRGQRAGHFACRLAVELLIEEGDEEDRNVREEGTSTGS